MINILSAILTISMITCLIFAMILGIGTQMGRRKRKMPHVDAMRNYAVTIALFVAAAILSFIVQRL